MVVIFLLLIFSGKARDFFVRIHKSKDNESTSWTRVIGTFIIVIAMGLYIHKAIYTNSIDDYMLMGLIGLALAGKVTQGAFNKAN